MCVQVHAHVCTLLGTGLQSKMSFVRYNPPFFFFLKQGISLTWRLPNSPDSLASDPRYLSVSACALICLYRKPRQSGTPSLLTEKWPTNWGYQDSRKFWLYVVNTVPVEPPQQSNCSISKWENARFSSSFLLVLQPGSSEFCYKPIEILAREWNVSICLLISKATPWEITAAIVFKFTRKQALQ